MPGTLTKKAIETVVAAGTSGKPYVMLWGENPKGLGLRIRQGGGVAWLYRYRPKDALRGAAVKTLTLGTWPLLSIEAARTLALGHAAKIAIGGDPGAELRQRKLRERSTVGAALDDYEADLKRRHIVNRTMWMSALRRGFAPAMAVEVSALDLRTVVSLIDAVASKQRTRKDGSKFTTPGAAKELRKLAHGFLNWAALRGLTPHNVLAGFRARKQSREESRLKRAREGRALTDIEIVDVWTAASSMGAFGALVKAGLLSGLRRSEIAGLRWSDIQDGAIVIPEGRAKTGKEHRVPVSPAMQALLTAQPRSASSLVFPSPVTSSAMSGWSRLLPKLIDASGVRFRLHDLRRTTRTIMSRLGVTEAVGEAAIGHAKSGLIAIYDKADFWNERIEAFGKISDHILALVEEGVDTKNTGNVVPLQRVKQM